MPANSAQRMPCLIKSLIAMPDMNDIKKVIIHTDGACLGNPGAGGWAAVLRYGEHARELSGGEADTTNNRMELMATIKALEALTKPSAVTLYTDSQYVQKGISTWLAGWKARGWHTKRKTPVLNKDLWQRLDKANATHKVDWRWVKGHAGTPDNERCDFLATLAARSYAPKHTKQTKK